MPTPEVKGFKDRSTGTTYALNDETARAGVADSLHLSAQELTSTQKAQVFENIGLVIDEDLDTEGAAADSKAAGDAIAAVAGNFDSKSTVIATTADFTEHGYLDNSGAFVAATTTQWTTDYIPVEQIVFYKLEYTSMRAVWRYDSNKTALGKIEASVYGSDFRFSDGTTACLRFNFNADPAATTIAFYKVKD